MTLYNGNLKLLEIYHPDCFREVLNSGPEDCAGAVSVEPARSGEYTASVTGDGRIFYLHSRYDPVKEAVRFAEEQINEEDILYVMYGFGLGYHVKTCIQRLKGNAVLAVLDLNPEIFSLALKNVDLSGVLASGSLELTITRDTSLLIRKLKDYISLKTKKKFILHMPSVNALKDTDLKLALENVNILKSVSEDYIKKLKENYDYNTSQIRTGIEGFKDLFKGKPAVLVAGGPSLTANIKCMKKLKNAALIFASGTALKPLINGDVRPDMFMVIDPSDSTLNQISGIEHQVPGVFLSTASKTTVSGFKGTKFLARYDMHEALEKITEESNGFKLDVGPSVAASMLEMLIQMGCSPIAFVGLDLSFVNGRHHADGTEHGEDNKFDDTGLRKLKNSRGQELPTTLALLSTKKWIEDKIASHKEVTFINCFGGGADIEGSVEMTLQAFIEKYAAGEYDFERKIAGQAQI